MPYDYQTQPPSLHNLKRTSSQINEDKEFICALSLISLPFPICLIICIFIA